MAFIMPQKNLGQKIDFTFKIYDFDDFGFLDA